MFLKKGALPRPGGQYQVEIVAANANESHDSLNVLQMDVQTLTVVVRSDDKLEDLLETKDPFEAAPLEGNVVVNARDYELDYGEGTGTQDEERWRNQEEEEGTDAKGYGGFEEPLGPDSDERDALGPQTLVRRKRETPADDGDTGSSELTLIEKNPPAGDMKPGMSIDYELVVVLPRLTTAIDLVIELFVMTPSRASRPSRSATRASTPSAA
nr:uncharacterized protein LOC113823239 [Penaeus vannamei]